MPRTLKLLLLASALAAPLYASAQGATQKPAAAAQTAPADDEVARGKQLLAQGDAAGAAAILKRAAERRKTDAVVWYNLGLALGQAGKAKDARKAFERAVKLRPDWPDAHAGVAFALLSLNKPRDAERAAGRALAADPRHSEAHYVVGYLRFNEEKFPDALSEAEAALRAKPDFTAAVYLAANALLNVYIDESLRQSAKYPVPREVSADERKALLAQREPALLPFKAHMSELADRLESLAAARPNAPDAENWREQAGTLRIYGRPLAEGGFPGIVPSDQLTTKAIITQKPEPGYTEKARGHNVTGTVRLRAVLGADGQVSHIVPIKRLPDGLTEKCIAAARKIRFTPATLDGHAVSQFVVLEYNFNIY